MHTERIDAAESIDYVIIYILATLQLAKVSSATVLSRFYKKMSLWCLEMHQL